MTLRVRKPSAESVLDDQEEDVSLSNIRQRRWRMAFRAIYCTRVLVSLTRKVLDHNNGILLHSLSYVAIDVNPGTDTLETQSFPEADKKMISEMVKEKKFEMARSGCSDQDPSRSEKTRTLMKYMAPESLVPPSLVEFLEFKTSFS
ncbi:hypothetical protein Ddye_025613 [Dipteronia dyeriana]|uniref:Uncharacterized protein n=1 Tax=Dipteronia dyeriana TaxID=168575 RepID=A0AAD9WPN8_9ROSI|nr:hypothetical protein Ddye_025613 [Dipteronia dyeriana]